MKLEGEQTLSGRPERVWSILLDPETIAGILPGCKAFEQVGADQYRGVLEARVGPIASQYNTKFTVRDKSYPDSYRLDIEGQGQGGFVHGSALIRLVPQDGGTLLRYDAEATVGGTIARVGQRLVETVAKMIVNQGFQELRKTVEARLDREHGSASGS